LDKNGFKRSESEFDTNKTNPFLSISIHFCGWDENQANLRQRGHFDSVRSRNCIGT